MQSEYYSTKTQRDIDLNSGIAAFEAKNFSQALAILAPLARDGLADAQYRMAIMFQNGLGTVRNESSAVQWMRAAAQQGHALAQHGLDQKIKSAEWEEYSYQSSWMGRGGASSP